jgi:acetolactate synthase small subunit
MNTQKSTLAREFALVRVVTDRQEDALRVAGAWSGRLIELTEGYFTVELSATPDRISGFLELMAGHGQITVVRSGALSLG